MAISVQNCPYCRANSVAFSAVKAWRIENDRRALLICGSCGEGIVREWFGNSDIVQMQGNIENLTIMLGRQWPEAPNGAAPKDTPENVAKFFCQGTSSLEIGNFDAAGMMFRKSLETATKILDPNLAGKPLFKRIDNLASAGKLTADMAEWAHEVRLGGNDAAHEDEPFSLESAEDLKNFVENFLTYAFTLPSVVRRREGRSETTIAE
ncbi:DUF4145 domain-containing protein [Erythrobacter donghaensis]|uniref:DUF4145 domain-containing protein n=1 Tax=Erythrobacter donghaensis TaxID=267135 RepID=UPI001B809949|nr:DUF4145 domain-containing protein [Erythrobacter donghaensis]